ncbi:HAD family hydrolase [Hyphomicrobium nitrativorans NL23]|uniref:HAD family hydrolase n=1 Tax=Hyphomicrobium nitrativorans NL23 TaxID=1029756 RepID=V5SEB6_9HYPH|nr:HAD family hydrolase [Hyphomicrobium nitrativorans NL23]
MKLVIFDCDGTLVDSQHMIVAAMTDAFASQGRVAPPRESVVGVVGLSLDWAIARLVPEETDPVVIERLSEAYKEAFRERRLGPDHTEPLYDGVRDVLDRLAAREDVSLGIATGKSRRGLDAVLEREGIVHHFRTIQTADTHPSKPHPSMIFAAMSEAVAEPVDTVMIGDTTFDIEMALGAGTSSIGVAWGYHPVDALRAAGAHHVTADCAELGRTLDRLMFERQVG